MNTSDLSIRRASAEYLAKEVFEALMGWTLTDVNVSPQGYTQLQFTDPTGFHAKDVEVWQDEEGNAPGWLRILDDLESGRN